MPTEAFTGAELDDSRHLLELLMTLAKNDDCDDALEDALLLAAAEPLQRTLQQDIGPERLSIARLQREAAARGQDVDDVRNFFVCSQVHAAFAMHRPGGKQAVGWQWQFVQHWLLLEKVSE